MTNWFKGIDENLSTPGGEQVALAGFFFVDVINGDNASGDGSPGNPWQTIEFALQNIVNGSSLVLASGNYLATVTSTNGVATKNDISIYANVNGTVIIKSDAIGTRKVLLSPTSTHQRCEGIYFKDAILGTRRNGIYSYCSFDITTSSAYIKVSTTAISIPTIYNNCHFLNGTIFRMLGSASGISDRDYVFNYCTFTDSISIEPSTSGANAIDAAFSLVFNNCDFTSDCVVNVVDLMDVANSELNHCNFRGTIVNSDTPSNVDFIETNVINQDPLYVGVPNQLEKIISENSPLIGSGENQTTIGAFKVGQLVDLSTPAENNNITVGPTIEITNPATTGNIKPQLKTLSKTRKSPIISSNGLIDNMNNVPDNESTALIPKRRTVNILYRETIGGADLTSEFLYGFPMFQDNSGNKTGEEDFDPFDISSTGDILNNFDRLTAFNLIDVAQIQENFVLNDQ